MNSGPSTLGPPRVLVVEDEPMLLKSLVAGLSRLPGVEVVGASSVGAAVAELKVRAPAVVISDIDLPDRSGIELLGELGARGLKPWVAFVSAYVKAYRAQIPPHAGVELLEKPVSLEQLRQLVTQHLVQPVTPAPFGVADYLQLASLGRHTVAVEVSGEANGEIVVVNGEAWSATDLHGTGMDAFRRLAAAHGVAVMCQTLVHEPGPRTLSGSCEGLLLECARLSDEEAAHGDAPSFTELSLEPAEPPPPDFDTLFEAGVEASLAKNYEAALESFRAAGELRPADLKVKVNVARLEKLLAAALGEA